MWASGKRVRVREGVKEGEMGFDTDVWKAAGPYFVTKVMDEELGATWWKVQGPGIVRPIILNDKWLAWETARIRNKAYEQGRMSAAKGEE